MATQPVTKYAAKFIPHVEESIRLSYENNLLPQVSALVAAKEAAKKELIQSIKAAVCEALQPRIDGLKKDMNDSKADFRKLHMCIDRVRKEQDELRTSQAELHRGIDKLDTINDELRTLVNKLEKDNIELKAYNKRLSEKDFLHQIRQCCYEYQEYMKERTTLNTIAELHQAMWNCWPAEDKDSSLHKEIFAAELSRYADRLAEERSGLGSKGVVADDDKSLRRAKHASDVLQRKVAFALSIRAGYVCPHLLDPDFLIQAVNEFDEVTVGNQKVCFADKPSWIALIKHIFERTPSLQPDVFEDVTYFVGTARTECT
jgi:DNA repair exonuclease SbcCD ATPase subunit